MPELLVSIPRQYIASLFLLEIFRKIVQKEKKLFKSYDDLK
jgi:hypothetical protein